MAPAPPHPPPTLGMVTVKGPGPGTYFRPCDVCGTAFKVRPSEVRKALSRGCNPPRFCSTKCQHETYRGEGNPKWRGGRVYNGTGYVYAYAPDHPYATQDGYVMEHRLVMERVVGRYLEPHEEVHHRNHVRDDNRPDNLELMPSKVVHREHHAYYKPMSCGICGTRLRRSIAHRRRWSQAFCSRRCAALNASNANALKARANR